MQPVSYVNTARIDIIARPANVTAYTVGQAIANNTPRLIVFPISASRRGGYINRARLITSNSAHTGDIRLHLFNSLVTAPADQTALNFTFTQAQDYEGFLDFTTFTAIGTSTFAFSESVIPANGLQFQNNVDNNLYGILEARAAFTPTTGQQFGIELYTEYSA
jgi:hypothetical protein